MAASSDDKDKANIALVRDHMEVVTQLQTDFSARDKLYEEIENIAYMKRQPRVPEGYPNVTRVQSPLAPHIVNTVTAALSMNPYKVQFDPVAIGPAGEENASLREHFFDAAWKRQEREKKRRIYRLYMHAKVLKGEGIIKTIERTKRAWSSYDSFSAKLSDRLADPQDEEYGDVAKRAAKTGDLSERDRIFNARTEEKKRELPYPIESTDVPPETFRYIKGEDGFSYCSEVKKVPYYSTLERFGVDLNKDGKVVAAGMGLGRNKWSAIMSGTKELTMYESWRYPDATYWLCGPGDDPKKDGQYIKSFKHGYCDPILKTLRGPYFQSFGITTSSREFKYQGLSVLFGWLKLFPWLDELLTIQGAAAYAYGYPKFKRKGETSEQTMGRVSPAAFGRDEQDEIERERDIEPGGILPWDIEPVEMPRSGPDLGEAIKICRGLIELCLPQVVQGLVNGDESGYLAAQATHLARLVWQPIVDNTEINMADRTSFESWLIQKKIRENVYVWGEEARAAGFQRRKAKQMWLGLGPDDIKDIHAYTVRIQPSTPSDDVIKVRTHDEMLKLRLETRDDAIVDMGNNPDEVRFGWMLEDLWNQIGPDVLQAAKAKITAKQQAQAADAALQQQNGGLGGAANGRQGIAEVIQPGQGGQPLTPPAPNAAGTGQPANMGAPEPEVPNAGG